MAAPHTLRKHDVARVGLLLFAVGWGTNHFVPLLLVYRARLGLTAVDLGTLFAVYALGLTPGLLIGGPLSDIRGRRLVVLPGALLALAGTALLAAGANRFGLLAAGRLLVGLGSGAVFSAGTAWIQDLSSDGPPGTGARRATIALSCGFGGGPLIGGTCAQWLARPVLTPYLVQAAALVCALALATKAPGGPRRPPDRATPPTPRAEDAGLVPARFFSEVGIVAPWVFAFPAIAFVVLPAAVRPHLGGYAVAYAGLVPAICLAAGILIQPLARHRPARRVAVTGLLTGALGLVGGRFATGVGSPALVLAAAVLLGVGYGTCFIAGLRWLEATVPPARRGRATGLFYVLTYLGFWTPTVMAALTRAIGEGATFWLGTALALATALATAARRWRSDEAG